MTSNKIIIITIVSIIIIIGIFNFLTIKDGHDWGGDFSMFIHHAKNIVEGVDYEDTGYIYNPNVPLLAPKTYPPVFPLLLVPIYKWFGLNFTIMKIEIVLFFLLSLFIIFLIYKDKIPFKYLIALIIIIGFNPIFFDYKNKVLSDIPFLFFTFLSIFLINKAYQSKKTWKLQILYIVMISISIYLAYGTRSLGLILIPCLIVYDIIRNKKLSIITIAITLLVGVFVVLQMVFFHSDIVYLNLFAQLNPKVILNNILSYEDSFSSLWGNGYVHLFQVALFFILFELAIVGYVVTIKESITISHIFLPLYLVLIIFFPGFQGIRYLFPIVPLFVYYALVGVKKFNFFKRKKIELTAFIIIISAIIISYAGKYTTIDYSPIREGVTKEESVEIFNYIKENTSEEDIVIFRKPRVLSLFTGRSSSVYHEAQDDKELWNYIKEINATHLIVGILDGKFLYDFVEKYSNNFEEVYSNTDFKIYKIR